MNDANINEGMHQYPINSKNVERHSKNLSIIIPTYKNIKFLKECINSLLAAIKNIKYEILLGIDNCMETVGFINSQPWAKNKDIHIFYFSKNVGPYIIRNTLYKLSRYENVLFFDSDDVMMKDSVEKILEKLMTYRIVKFKFYNFIDGTDYLKEKLKLSSQIAHGAFAIRSDCFRELTGFFGWKCGADTEFLERYEHFGYVCYKFEQPLFYRRYHGNNITKSQETGINSEFREKYRQYIYKNRKNNEWKNPNFFETFFYSKIVIH
jgi:glycosyltransferase involved in cell wall biosynthesis